MKIHDYAKDQNIAGIKSELAKGVPVDARDEENYTPLAYSIRYAEGLTVPILATDFDESPDVIKYLINARADVNTIVGDGNDTPLSLVLGYENIEAARILLNAGARITTEVVTRMNKRLEQIADFRRFGDGIFLSTWLIQKLSDAQSDLDLSNAPIVAAYIDGDYRKAIQHIKSLPNPAKQELSEISYVVAFGNTADLKAYISDSGFSEDNKPDFTTAGLIVSIIGDVEKAKILEAHGWDINKCGPDQDAPILRCAKYNHCDMLAWLLESGAEVETVDDCRMSALMYAAAFGASDCVDLLLKASAKIELENSNQNLGISIASSVDLLKKVGINMEHEIFKKILENCESEAVISLASNVEIARQLQHAGADIGLASRAIKRRLTGLSEFKEIRCSKEAFLTGRNRRFGASNPELMNIEFWREMVRVGCSAYAAQEHFHERFELEKVTWCFDRFGCSFTELPDGRFVQIGGEHEDFYDPNFCIYNDVIVHTGPGEFQIYGYPKSVFPPTDFHTATYVDGYILIVGCAGYMGERYFPETPVYRLSCEDWSITAVKTSGEQPGWISDHKAKLTNTGCLRIWGGKVGYMEDNNEVSKNFQGEYELDLISMEWRKTK